MEKHITTTEQERNFSVFAHLGTFIGYIFPLAPFLVPLIIWLSNKESKFISDHGKAVLNFQISLLLYHILIFIIGVVLSIDHFTFLKDNILDINEVQEVDFNILFILLLTLGILLLFQIFYIVTTIIGAVRASKGRIYNYPLTIRFIH